MQIEKCVDVHMGRQTLYVTVANGSAMIKQYTFSKNSNETRRIWGYLAAPVVANSGKKHVHFPYVNSDSREKCIEYIFQYCFQKSSEKCIGSPNPYIYRCKFFENSKTKRFFKKLQRERSHFEKPPAGEKDTTIILQIPLGNRNWSIKSF